MREDGKLDPAFTVRRMTRGEVDLAIDWAAIEGWNPGVRDAECFHAVDAHGFFVGELDCEPVACMSAVAYDEHFGFIGLYIVKPGLRGRGFGMRIWQAGLAYLADRNIGLDGVVAQQGNYSKSGFELAYRNIRYEGVGESSTRQGSVDLATVPFGALVAYDRQLFPAARPQFLQRWIDQPGGAALGVLREERLGGYGVLRRCRRGFKIGPLFADDERIAEDLFQTLAANVPGAPVFLDVPEPNAAAVSLAERHGMRKVFETARMYTQKPPAVAIERVFGVTSFELG